MEDEKKTEKKKCPHHVISGICPICFPEDDDTYFPWEEEYLINISKKKNKG